MKQTCSQRLRWLHSLQFKYMVTLFVIVFIACAITYMIMFMSVWGQVRHAAEEQLQSITDFLTSVMERSNMPVNEVIDLLQPRVDSIGLAKTEEALPAGFRLDTPLEQWNCRCFSYSRRIYLVVCKNRFHACQMDSSVGFADVDHLRRHRERGRVFGSSPFHTSIARIECSDQACRARRF